MQIFNINVVPDCKIANNDSTYFKSALKFCRVYFLLVVLFLFVCFVVGFFLFVCFLETRFHYKTPLIVQKLIMQTRITLIHRDLPASAL